MTTSHIFDSAKDPSLNNFVKTKAYKELYNLIDPDYPINVYIGGETGIGKSSTVMAVCKDRKIPCIRVNCSYATDVDDLMGGLRLKNNETVFEDGPVITAMRVGAVLIADEVDTAQPGILMELHPVAERKGVLIKKTGEYVIPHPNFRIVATGNTKGRGDSTGQYVGTRPMNIAFLDRFSMFYEFPTPTSNEIKNIIKSNPKVKIPQNIIEFIGTYFLDIKKAKETGAVESDISIRRINDIAVVFSMFGISSFTETRKINSALDSIFSFYDDDMKKALLVQWKMMQPKHDNTDEEVDGTVDPAGSKIPF